MKRPESITTDLYRSLKVRCAVAGVTLAQICRDAGVDRRTLDKWKRKTPKSIESLRRLEAIIERAELNTEK